MHRLKQPSHLLKRINESWRSYTNAGIRKPDARKIRSTRLNSEVLMQPFQNDDWKIVQKQHFQQLSVPENWMIELEKLDQRLNLNFRNPELLMCALLHHSYRGDDWSQRLRQLPYHRMSNRAYETLGDSVLGLVVSSYLFQTYPSYQEGALTKLRSGIVNNRMLSAVCVQQLNMHDLILVGESLDPNFNTPEQQKEAQYAHGRQTVQAGAVESLIGSIFLDQGLEAASTFINDQVLSFALTQSPEELLKDPISSLQDYVQKSAKPLPLPEYRREKEGVVSIYINNTFIARAKAKSYKQARRLAAEKALKKIETVIKFL